MLGRLGFVLSALAAAPFLAAGCGGGGSSSTAANPTPAPPPGFQVRTSQKVLPFANGFAASSYNLDAHKLDAFLDHIYAKRSPTETSTDFCHDAYFGWRRGGTSQWLDQTLESSAGYVDGTGIVKVAQRAGGFLVETYWFAPFTGGAEQAIVGIVRLVNEGADATDCSIFALANMKLGGGTDATREWAFYDPAAPFGPYVMEGKDQTGNRMVYKPLGGVPAHSSYAAAGPSSPYSRVLGGEHLVDPTGALNADDIACAFEWQVNGGGAFASGAEAWAGVAIAFRADGDETAVKRSASDFAAGKTPQELLQREIDGWNAFHSVESLPPTLSAAERSVLRQSTAVIRMAQCREPGGPEGQILASLPPGQWNVCWPRDASYAIAGLVKTGHSAEAKKGLEFFLRGTADQYRPQVGRKYKISVCRYFGNGLEESDDNGHGPNVEYDDFGLFLWAFADYVERANDGAFLATHWPVVRDEVADVLVSLIAPNELLKADSSIWERHLTPAPNTPDGKKQFAYSSIQAAHGLSRAASLATRAGDAAKATEYRDAAAKLTRGIERELALPDGALAGSVEEKNLGAPHAADASVVEAMNLGIVPGSSTTAAKTLAYLDRELKAWPLRSPGYLRVDDARHYGPDNWYDRQEWVVIDLRIASALLRAGRRADAQALIDWVTAQAGANYGLIAELYDEVSSGYQGAVPMAGFGGGAYILAEYDLHLGVPR